MSALDDLVNPPSDDPETARAARVRANGERQAATLGQLALQLHEEDQRARAQEAERAAELSAQLRVEYGQRQLRENVDLLRTLVARKLDLPEESPLLERLDWRIDEEYLAQFDFIRSATGDIIPDNGRKTNIKMNASTEGMPLSATLETVTDRGQSLSLFAKTNTGLVIITNMLGLGRAIADFKRWS